MGPHNYDYRGDDRLATLVTVPSAQNEADAKPFLRWAGSKRSMLSKLRSLVPSDYGTYIEPFVGSACLFFDTNPAKAVLGDLNDRLIEMYGVVARDPERVARLLAELPVGSDAYYSIRQDYKTEKDELRKAAMLIYLNRFCFNGLYRTNQQGFFNVPYGAPRSAAVPTERDLVAAAKKIQGANLLCGDFESVIRRSASPGDFVYLDPPFHVSKKRVFRQYTATPFTRDDFTRLRNLLADLDGMGVKFLLSYAYSIEAERELKRYNVCMVETRRNISGFPQHRSSAEELLVSNYGK